MLTSAELTAVLRELRENREREQIRLGRIHRYLHNDQPTVWLPEGAPLEVRRFAQMSRVNLLRLVVDTVAQALYVDGYRAPRADEDAAAWDVWQRNRMDARQIGVHRAALAYGVGYVTVLPGDPVPVIRGVSPRNMTALYATDADWPEYALEHRGGRLWRLFDRETVHWLEEDGEDLRLRFSEEHGLAVVPVVRFRAIEDLDGDTEGELESLLPLQDQINLTTFSLLVAQHYGAFRQRWIIGWMAETENQRLQAAASKLWTFDGSPDEVKVGEFEQTDLRGYIESREATLRHLATLSQTPAHELLGQLVNLSAEALAAAEASFRRKVCERQSTFGEAWEQVLELAGRAAGYETDPAAQVRWRDTESRAFAATVDGLMKLQSMGVPFDLLVERIPGLTQQDVERARMLYAQGDAFAQLNQLLTERAGTVGGI